MSEIIGNFKIYNFCLPSVIAKMWSSRTNVHNTLPKINSTINWIKIRDLQPGICNSVSVISLINSYIKNALIYFNLLKMKKRQNLTKFNDCSMRIYVFKTYGVYRSSVELL